MVGVRVVAFYITLDEVFGIAYFAYIANTATTIIPKITVTSFSCPFKPNTIRMSSQTE
jgi:hypothetical protein